MWLKIAVIVLFTTLVILIAAIIFRRKIKGDENSTQELSESGKLPGTERLNWEDSLQALTLLQLKRKLLALEREKQQAALGFLQMNPAQQQDAIAQGQNISKKIEIVKKAIDQFSL